MQGRRIRKMVFVSFVLRTAADLRSMSVVRIARVGCCARVFLAASVLSGCCGARASVPVESAPTALSPADILARVADRYARAGEYLDSGDVRIKTAGTPVADECPFRFTTIFRRSDGELIFRFRDRCPDLGGGAHQEGGRTRVWLDLSSGKDERTADGPQGLTSALQELAGVTSGTSRYVPALLFGYDAFGLKSGSTRLVAAASAKCGFEWCRIVEIASGPFTRMAITVDGQFLLREINVEQLRDPAKPTLITVRFAPARIQ